MPTCYTMRDLQDVYNLLPDFIKRSSIIVGDFSMCLHGYPCIARDFDFMLPKSFFKDVMAWIVENNIPHGVITVKSEDIGYVIEAKIANRNVSFNLEPEVRVAKRYKRDWIVEKMGFKTYIIERYLVARIGRIGIFLRQNPYRVPYELADIVPLVCENGIARLDRAIIEEIKESLSVAPIWLDSKIIEASYVIAGHLMDRYSYVLCDTSLMEKALKMWGLWEE